MDENAATGFSGHELVGRILLLVCLSLTSSVAAVAAGQVLPNAVSTEQGSTSNQSLWKIAADPQWGSQAKIVEPANNTRTGGRFYNVAETHNRFESDPAASVYYRRYVYTINNASGLDQSDAITIEFDPQFQRVVLHKAQLLRGGKVISQLNRNNIQLLQREMELESGLYNGEQTLHLLLTDQRIGDQVEYSYSLVGRNPVFGDHVFGWVSLQAGVPVGNYVYNLRYPAEKTLQVKNYYNDVESVKSEEGGYKAIGWNAIHTEPSRYQSDVPPELIAETYVQFSDFENWAEVSRWAAPHYKQPEFVHEAVVSKAQEIIESTSDIELQIDAVIGFVQDNIRYTGINSGMGGFVPDPAHEIIARRYGDCKDKAVLMIALLDELGISAYPALVHSKDGEGIPGYLPSPDAFNHLIVKLSHERNDYWVDGTMTLQGSSLKTLAQGRYHNALVVDEKPVGLEEIVIADPRLPEESVLEEYALKYNADNAPTTLTITAIYRGARAETLRHSLQSNGADDLQTNYLEYYQNRFGKLTIETPLQVTDNRQENVLQIVEHYSIPQAWDAIDETGNFEIEFKADAVLSGMSLPSEQRRFQPLAISHPFYREHIIVVESADGWAIETEEISVLNKYMDFAFKSRVNGNNLMLSFRFKTLANQVPVSASRNYIRDLESARANTYYPIEVFMPRSSESVLRFENQLSSIGSWFRQNAEQMKDR